MSVTISQTLREKIQRRAARAWRRHRDGESRKLTRIKNVSDTELEYRVPYTPDYYGKEWVRVVLDDDGEIIVNPPTTGLIDVKKDEDFERLNNHAGEIRAYLKVGPNGHVPAVGDQIPGPYAFRSRRHISQNVKRGDRVFVVETHADLVKSADKDSVVVSTAKVVEELDLVKDFQFTVGLFDCRTKADVESLRKKKHLGRVRAYKYVTTKLESPINVNKIKYEVGKEVEVKDAITSETVDCGAGLNMADIDWCKKNSNGNKKSYRALAFEFEMSDIAAIPIGTDGKFRVHRALCVEEVDLDTFKPIEVSEEPKKKGFMDKLFGGKDAEE